MTKLLIIDDNEHQHELFRVYAMFSDNFITHHAITIEDAVDYLEKEDDYDLVFLDNRLHPYNSYQESLPHLGKENLHGKLIVFSSDIDDETSKQIKDYGVVDFVNKSAFTLSNFENIVNGYLPQTDSELIC